MSSKQPTYEELLRQLQEAEQKRKEEERKRHLAEKELVQVWEIARPISLLEALCVRIFNLILGVSLY